LWIKVASERFEEGEREGMYGWRWKYALHGSSMYVGGGVGDGAEFVL
jgi:hypothetical protein